MFSLPPPRHISTLPFATVYVAREHVPSWRQTGSHRLRLKPALLTRGGHSTTKFCCDAQVVAAVICNRGSTIVSRRGQFA